MTVETAEGILEGMHTGVKIAVRHRFAGDKGTILRLDNYAMINIFDDGRYYIQGENTDELVIAFGLIEEAWDPDTWTGEIANPDAAAHEHTDARERPPIDPGRRFEF
jgi:hypothetical protein